MIDIDKAFEGRWRIKGDLSKLNFNEPSELYEQIKDLCRDFFEAGIVLGHDYGKEIKIFDVDRMHEPTEQFDGQLMSPFEYWWDLYDKKRGKEKCMKKWSKMTNEECVACIAATPAYVASTPDKAYRKDPLTYLNGKCWNDEIIMSNGNKQPTAEEQRINKFADILTD